ncbi:bifunctional serine/threonine-protein kinase/ABC transporter substrate-binding protein [Streptomyces sp. ODS05-4]|uniref:bifunctional serine/threonine-protein kinase/ABC transporter substrate-binding protein n=1 Tax=Streptomyces sp. ODS05-4 TaxID=2944939 RepID=UPI00210B3E0B|nr:ABC transporter substrate-binding protein [Streptomyces sp. ODS05-4]
MAPLRPTDPSRIAGYRMLGRLGAGGMGVVLLGRSTGGALAAVKIIHPSYAQDAAFRERFRREVRLARQVRSRYAVPVVDADTEALAPWLATEFVPGPPLGEAVDRTGPLPEHSVLDLGRMLAEALEAVHTAGMVHRDVKPGNVLLAPDGPRLIDFGIARALDDTVLTATDMVVGSPGFLAPEQARGEQPGPAGDVFSLGCVLAYAATGERPFGAGPVEAVLYRTVHDTPRLDALPGPLRPVVAHCLAKDAAQRPTAAELRALLTRDTPAEGWLPAPIDRLIAERSARMLALPDIEATRVEPAGPGATTAVTAPPARPSWTRRRTLTLIARAAALTAGSTTAFWLLGEDRPTPPPPAPRRPTLHIALQADLSGPGAAAGRAHRQGVDLAVAQHNARADAPFTLAVVRADDRGDTALATAAARRFAADQRIVAVIGATADEAAGAALADYDAAGLPVISALDGDIRHLNRVYLRARPDNALQMHPVAQYLGAHDLDRIAVVDDGSEYGRQTTRPFAEALRGTGRRTVIAETVEPGATDVPATVAALLARRPGAVVWGGGPEALPSFARALADQRYRGPRLAAEAAYTTAFPRTAGPAADGWLVLSTALDPSTDRAGDFARAFRARHGGTPPVFAAEAYDVLRLLASAAASLERPAPTRHDLLPVLRRTAFDGVGKRYAFNAESGGYVGTGMFLNRVEAGRFRWLGQDATRI